MDEYLLEALEIVKAQAGVRTMTEEEILSMVRQVSVGIRMAYGPAGQVDEPLSPDVIKNPIKEKSILCQECGKSFKIITRKHLAAHNLTPNEYRERWGLKKDTALVCKSLQRARRQKMKDMKLWEKRKKNQMLKPLTKEVRRSRRILVTE